jgi:hypothetical protein
MLSSISWSQFFTTLFLLLVIYYFFVISLFYKKEIFRFFIARPKPDGFPFYREANGMPLSDGETTKRKAADDTVQSQDLTELLNNLTSLLTTAAKAKTIKEELVMALQILLRDYSYLKDLPIKAEINQHVFAEVQNICSITLSEAEMKMLWNG